MEREMGPGKTKKPFDCIAYKRRVQAEIYEETKGMTPREEIEYFNHAAETGPLADVWKRIRAATKARKSAR
jgi:hypothetical protein